MSFRQKHENGNRAVAVLASCFVILGGAATCAAIVVSVREEHFEAVIVSIAAATAAMLIVLCLLFAWPPENRMKAGWGWLSRERKRRVPYRIRARIPAGQRVTSPPAPPTVETIRAITGRQSTWVAAPQASASDPSGAGR